MTDFPTPPAEIIEKLDEMNSWRNQRELEYGSLGTQLNLLWDDIHAGLLGEAAKTGSWYLHVKAIKDDITKPDMDTLQSELDALIVTEED